MIEIIGSPGTSEYQAAEKVRKVFESFLDGPDLDKSDVRIIVSAKTYGERRQDIDLIVVGRLARPTTIPPSRVVKKRALLLSFFLTIEVKDHPPSKVIFRGPKAFVLYKDRSEDASEQAEQQKYSAKRYIEKHGLDAPFIISLLLFNTIPTEKLPKTHHNILGGDFTSKEFLEAIYVSEERRLTDSQLLIQAFNQRDRDRYLEIARIFTKELQATNLDRKKIELITKQRFDQGYAKSELGKQLLVFSGPGGTGKTVKLLQLAHYIYQEKAEKSLILTYNLSLVSDIRRLMGLMGMRDDIATACVRIATVHSFMYELLCDAHLFTKGASGFLTQYETLKNELLSLAGALQKDEIPYWDHVFVDEAQDWPENERDIIFTLYGVQNTIIADGRAQLIRSAQHCDWTKQKTIKSQTVSLSKSLRLKHDICKFVVAIIDKLSIPEWSMTADVSVYGGRVIIALGDLSRDNRLVARVVADAKAAGNCAVDLFFCLPPSMVCQRPQTHARATDWDSSDEKYSPFGDTLQRWGYSVWDGVDEVQRQSYPTSVDQLRIVQYDSCRGLEGWTVINFAVDELYDYKRKSFKPNSTEKSDFFFDAEQAADQYAKKWLGIPLTRAIDTLVINIRNPDHWLRDIFVQAAQFNDAVEIYDCQPEDSGDLPY